jgi:hypothetical protein
MDAHDHASSHRLACAVVGVQHRDCHAGIHKGNRSHARDHGRRSVQPQHIALLRSVVRADKCRSRVNTHSTAPCTTFTHHTASRSAHKTSQRSSLMTCQHACTGSMPPHTTLPRQHSLWDLTTHRKPRAPVATHPTPNGGCWGWVQCDLQLGTLRWAGQ